MGERYPMSIDEMEELIAFIKMHEREEIPEALWDMLMEWQEWLEESS